MTEIIPQSESVRAKEPPLPQFPDATACTRMKRRRFCSAAAAANEARSDSETTAGASENSADRILCHYDYVGFSHLFRSENGFSVSDFERRGRRPRLEKEDTEKLLKLR